jgi:hypothetical protein
MGRTAFLFAVRIGGDMARRYRLKDREFSPQRR